MTRTRWRKVISDLAGNKTRTILTMLTITIGVFTIGFVSGMQAIVLPDTDAFYAAANVHSAMIYTSPVGGRELEVVRQIPGVTEVEGRSSVMVRLLQAEDRKYDLKIDGIPSLSGIQMDRLLPADPAMTPTLGEDEIWIEKSSLQIFPAAIGDTLEVQLPDGSVRKLRLAGIVQDASMPSAIFGSALSAFANPATVQALGGPETFNHVLLVIDDHTRDKKRVESVVAAASDRLRSDGARIDYTWIYNPGEHFSRQINVGVMTVMTILGGVAVLMSAILVINTISSVLGQHVRQIGIMKAIGAGSGQIIGMYLVFVLACGFLALLLAVPLAALAAYGSCIGLSGFINISLRGFRLAPQAVAAQAVAALVVPILAAALPVLTGTRIPVREAIQSHGMKNSQFGHSWIDRSIEKIRFLSCPMLLALRNTVRSKGRLMLTLSTLTLGGAIFIAVFNLWRTCDVMLLEIKGYFMADVNVSFAKSYPVEELEPFVMKVPEVVGMEAWGGSEGQIAARDGSDSTPLYFYAPPADSTLIQPVIVAGRWLEPGDQNAIVIGNHLRAVRPDLKIGDTVAIDIAGKETAWKIVGFFKMVGNVTPPPVYTYKEILDKYLPDGSAVSTIRLTTAASDPATQVRVSKALEEVLTQEGIPFTQIQLSTDWFAQQKSAFNTLIYFLLVMAVLIALVGGLGLTGMMSMNVMERTREIGVLRAVGASNGSILRMVVAEGALIGLVSWVLALVFSFPLTLALDAGVGQAMFQQNMTFAVGGLGMGYWLGGVLLLSALASALPALRAVRLTVRDVLAYE